MKKLFAIVFLFFIIINFSFSQIIVRGKITDNNGETIVGVSILLKPDPNHHEALIGTTTDLNGNYTIKIAPNKKQVVVISYIGYKTIEDTIKTPGSGVVIKDYILTTSSQELNAIVISDRAVKSSEGYIEKLKSKSAVSIDFISAETIKKTGDANVGSAISRVTGVSTHSGGLITVRGIGDRYVKTTINGSRIPTLDPFTNNIKLDIFPSTLIDNIVITKTASPDLPGDWSGAYISIDTKDYPDSLSVFLETSFGYNDQSTLKNITTSSKSSTDWLGYDNSFREYDHKNYIQFKDVSDIDRNAYYDFAALGLSDYFKSLGVTNISLTANDPNFKLGLIQLGLLGRAQYNDVTAVNNAINQFNTLEYKGKAFDIINANAIPTEKKFDNNWNTTNRKSPLNNSQTFTIGNQKTLFGNPIGFIVGFRYFGSTQYDTNSIKNRYTFVNNVPSLTDGQYSKSMKVCKETNGWSGLANIAYKLNKNNTISALFMPNLIGTNNVKDAIVSYYDNSSSSAGYLDKQTRYFNYESRRQLIYQLKSEHYIPSNKTKIEFNASYTNGNSNAPDSKTYDSRSSGSPIFYRYLTDNVLDSRISAEIPISKKAELVRKIKIGGEYMDNRTQNKFYAYQLMSGTGAPKRAISQDSLFDGVTSYNTDYTKGGLPYRTAYEYFNYQYIPTDNMFGKSNIIAGYAMVNYSIIPNLRLAGGVRAEKFYIHTDCFLFDSLNLPVDDKRRLVTDINNITTMVNPGNLEKTSYLPSVNLIYKLNNNEATPINIRINYSQTVSRPSIRELSKATFYDFESNVNVIGNPNLKISQTDNYDFRFESYFKSGDNISISVFYKKIKNLIQFANENLYYSWINNESGSSNLKGVEIEGKKNLFKWLEFRANLTLVNSMTKTQGYLIMDPNAGVFFVKGGTTPMFGQAPYVFNSMITYSSKKYGVTASLSYNLQGTKLVVITDINSPNVYELPRNVLDFKVSKKIGKHLSASLKIFDILNSPIQRSYEFENNSPYFKKIWEDITNKYKDANNKYIYSKNRWGTNYIFALSYKF